MRFFGFQIKKTQSLGLEKVYYENIIKGYKEIFGLHKKYGRFPLNDQLCAIVVSKDRAMQLHALLSSYFYYTQNPAPLNILYTYSSEEHKQAYKILQKEFEKLPVVFIFENEFANQLKDIIKNAEGDRIFFMTDDGIFLDHYDLNDCLQFDPLNNIFSLRLGVDFDFCYSYNIKQLVPGFTKEDSWQKLKSWTWADMKNSPDWIYPLSVDATIFLRKEIELILANISFKSPNSLEAQMQLYNDLFICRKGICYETTKYVNVPCNIVQNEFDNIFTGAYSVSALLDRFLKGDRIDWRKLQDCKPRDAQTVVFEFIKQAVVF